MTDRTRVARSAVVHIAYTYAGVIRSLCGKPFAWGDVLRGPPNPWQRLCRQCERMSRKPESEVIHNGA